MHPHEPDARITAAMISDPASQGATVSAVPRTLSCVGAVLMLFAVTCVSWATAQSDAIVFVGGIVLTQD